MVGTSNLGSWNGHWSEREKIFVPKGVGSKTTQLIGTSTPGRHSLKIAEKTKLSDSNHQAILPSWFKLWFPEYLYLSIYIYIIIYIYIYSIFSLSSHSIFILFMVIPPRILRASSREAPTKSKPNGTSEPWWLSKRPGFCWRWMWRKMGVSENSVLHFPNGFADHYPY